MKNENSHANGDMKINDMFIDLGLLKKCSVSI